MQFTRSKPIIQVIDEQFIRFMATEFRRPIIRQDLKLTFTQADYFALRGLGVSPLSTVQEMRDREKERA